MLQYVNTLSLRSNNIVDRSTCVCHWLPQVSIQYIYLLLYGTYFTLPERITGWQRVNLEAISKASLHATFSSFFILYFTQCFERV